VVKHFLIDNTIYIGSPKKSRLHMSIMLTQNNLMCKADNQ